MQLSFRGGRRSNIPCQDTSISTEHTADFLFTTQIFGSVFLVDCIQCNLENITEFSCFNRFFELSMLALSKVTDTNYSISGLTKYSKESVHHSMFTCLSIYSSDISNTSHTISTYLIIILNFIICSNIVRQFSYFTFNTINKMFQC